MKARDARAVLGRLLTLARRVDFAAEREVNH